MVSLKKNVVVYGMGETFNKLRERIMQQYEVVACTDSNGFVSDGFLKKRFINPQDILKYDFEEILICSTRYYKEIKSILLNMGIHEKMISGPRSLISENDEAKIIISAWKDGGLLTPQNKAYGDQVFVVGDSHSCFFGGGRVTDAHPLGDLIGINGCNDKIRPFKVFHTGPGLAYNAHKYETFVATREKVDFLLKYGFIPQHSRILCSFGEIDIRVHAIKQAERQGVPIRSIVEDIINNYLKFLLFLKKRNHVLVWGTIALTKEGAYRDPLWPYYGSEKERNITTEYFNERLKLVCKENNITYISLFNYLVDKNYITKGEYLYDGYHLSQKAWAFAVEEFASKGIDVIL